MKAHQAAKAAGLKNLNHLAELSEQSPQTLLNWFNNKRKLFDLVLSGAALLIKTTTNAKPHIIFEDWFNQLDKLAIEEGFFNEKNSEPGKEYWKSLYDQKLTPKQAFYKETSK